MSRFDVLDRTVAIHSSRFLEASAGTGKTFAIEHIVSRLLIEGATPLTLEQILVVTFTRAATRELKLRIRTNLEKNQRLLENRQMEGAPDYIVAIIECQNVAEAISRVETALANFDQAQIFTIHAFCHQALSQFAFEGKVALQLADPDTRDYVTLLRLAIFDFFRTGLHPSAYSPRQIGTVLQHQGHDMEKLAKKLMRIIGNRGELPVFPDFSESARCFNDALGVFGNIEEHKFLQDYEQCAPCYKKMKGKEAQAKIWGALLEKNNCSLAEFDDLLSIDELFLKEMHPENLKVRARLPDPSSLHYPGIFERLRTAFISLIDDAKKPVQIELRMARECQSRWQASFPIHEAFSPDDILNKMEACLEQPPFLQAMRCKYRAGVIDEFQDTDPVQWRIFQRIFQPPAVLYLVGDPKQSIYSFRRADVYTYLEAQELLGPEKKAYLDTNFRSDPALVTALNTFFSASPWLQLPEQKRALSFIKVKARPGAVDSALKDQKGSLHFFIAEGSPEKKRTWPTQALEEQLLFPYIAGETERLIEIDAIAPEEIVILINDRHQAQRLHQFFKKYGLPSQIKRTGNLAETEGFAAVEQLIKAAADPDDLNELKQVLIGPLIGYDHQRLKQLDIPSLKARFFEFSNTISEHGFGCFYERFMSSRWDDSAATLLERCVAREDLALYHELRQTAQLIVEREEQGAVSFDALLLYMKELKQLDPENDERIKIKPENDEPSVQIMTTHMSKGLEFDVVFALGAASTRDTKEEIVNIKAENREKIALNDPEDPLCILSKQEQGAEKMRQLYVALTRGRKRVYVPLVFGNKDKDSDAAIDIFGKTMGGSDKTAWLEFLDKSGFTHDMVSASEERFKIKKQNGELIPPRPVSIPNSPQWMQSFTTLSRKTAGEHLKIKFTAETKNIHALPMGAETGIILHAILEKIFVRGLQRPYQELAIAALIEAEIEETPLDGWSTIIAEMIREVLHMPLGGFALTDSDSARCFSEMEFIFSRGADFLKGVADLVFEIDGKVYFIDWKSNWLGPDDAFYDSVHMEKAMEEHDYFLQASIYAEALKRYLNLFEKNFGEALYIFLRGRKVYRFNPKTLIVI